jgi:hypothetical protein
MEFYTPYFTRVGRSLASPFLNYILDAAIFEHHADFYAHHLVGLPLIIRMGGDDNNVPPYHLRRMVCIAFLFRLTLYLGSFSRSVDWIAQLCTSERNSRKRTLVGRGCR